MQRRRNAQQEILFATQLELNQQGLTFTMDYLTIRLSTSKRSLYQNFSSKEELLSTVIDKKLAEISMIESTVYQKSNLVLFEQLRQLLLLYFQLLHFFHKVALENLKTILSEPMKNSRRIQAEWQKIDSLLRKKISKGQIRPVYPAILDLIIHNSLQELLRAPPLPKEIKFSTLSTG